MKNADTPLARQVRAIMESGGYVSDEITNEIVKDRLAQRTVRRAFCWTVTHVRCSRCGRSTTTSARPSAPGCGHLAVADTDEVVARLLRRAAIDGRSDDNEETIRVRLQVYAEQTEPLLDVYRSRGLLVEDGLGEIDEVSERVFAALDAHRERSL